MKKKNIEVIKLLKNNKNKTYDELSKMTGYHPKSLIRINSEIKKGTYKLSDTKRKKLNESLINEYINGNYKTIKDFYNKISSTHNISYSKVCKLLNNTKLDKQILFIRKTENTFEVIDFQNKVILFTTNKSKSNIKNIIYKVLLEYGAPDNISFINFFYKIPRKIEVILNKYHINILKSVYRRSLNNISSNNKKIKYKKVIINKEDFYNHIIRKTIDKNTIQFNNIRYRIITEYIINKNTSIDLFYDNQKSDLFIKFDNSIYKLKPFKQVTSKKGNTKY